MMDALDGGASSAREIDNVAGEAQMKRVFESNQVNKIFSQEKRIKAKTLGRRIGHYIIAIDPSSGQNNNAYALISGVALGGNRGDECMVVRLSFVFFCKNDAVGFEIWTPNVGSPRCCDKARRTWKDALEKTDRVTMNGELHTFHETGRWGTQFEPTVQDVVIDKEKAPNAIIPRQCD